MAEKAKKTASRATKVASKTASSTKKKSTFPLWIIVALIAVAGGLFLAKQMSGGMSIGNMKMIKEVDPASVDQWSYFNGYDMGTKIKASIDQLPEGMEVDNAVVIQAISDVLNEGEMKMTEDQAIEVLEGRNEIAAENFKKLSEKNSAEGAAYIATYKTESGVQEGVNGVPYKVLASGSGETVGKNVALVQYVGKKIDGEEFDSSFKNGGNPVPFASDGVIPGLGGILETMKVGDKYEIAIPGEQAYAENIVPGVIGPNETLIFEVEVTSVQDREELIKQQQAAQAEALQAQQAAQGQPQAQVVAPSDASESADEEVVDDEDEEEDTLPTEEDPEDES